jgi:hypothetical protein
VWWLSVYGLGSRGRQSSTLWEDSPTAVTSLAKSLIGFTYSTCTLSLLYSARLGGGRKSIQIAMKCCKENHKEAAFLNTLLLPRTTPDSPWSTRYRETRLVSWTRLHRWRLSRSSGWEKHTISILKIIINTNKCLIHQIQCCSYIRLFLQGENPYLTHKKQKFNIFLIFCLFSQSD